MRGCVRACVRVCTHRSLQTSLSFTWSKGQQTFPDITTPLCLCSEGSHRPNVNDGPGCDPVEFYSQNVTSDEVVSQMSVDFFSGSLTNVDIVFSSVVRCSPPVSMLPTRFPPGCRHAADR